MSRKNSRSHDLPDGFPTAKALSQQRQAFEAMIARMNKFWYFGREQGKSEDDLREEIAKQLRIEPRFTKLFIKPISK